MSYDGASATLQRPKFLARSAFDSFRLDILRSLCNAHGIHVIPRGKRGQALKADYIKALFDFRAPIDNKFAQGKRKNRLGREDIEDQPMAESPPVSSRSLILGAVAKKKIIWKIKVTKALTTFKAVEIPVSDQGDIITTDPNLPVFPYTIDNPDSLSAVAVEETPTPSDSDNAMDVDVDPVLHVPVHGPIRSETQQIIASPHIDTMEVEAASPEQCLSEAQSSTKDSKLRRSRNVNISRPIQIKFYRQIKDWDHYREETWMTRQNGDLDLAALGEHLSLEGELQVIDPKKYRTWYHTAGGLLRADDIEPLMIRPNGFLGVIVVT